MDRFGPTRKVSKKLVHLLRWTTFPGRTGRKFLVEWIAPQQPYGPTIPPVTMMTMTIMIFPLIVVTMVVMLVVVVVWQCQCIV